ncbi:hypothetical protein CR194_10755 [Salipaludibacillus keqinensis]|uniref:Fimbrial assembly protein n=1 Tax=Salipaludibacillus keqinensis TaxID=2045207 RepID=A0A323TGN2_9BACI|nr:hypothetical protein [Salipaludibacillus keqinensis]PYZ93630.1 hypothetical protein CR194_10755 [Salipaludibacillus keqinensis]
MNVEINLLPKKPVKKRMLFYVFSGLLILFLLAFIYAYLQKQNLEREQDHLVQELETVQLLQEAERNQELETGSDEERLDRTVELLTSQNKSTPRLLSTFVAQLPERGFFTWFQYEEPGTVNLDVQFESQREAASYLHALNEHYIVDEAMITDLTTEELDENEDTVTMTELPRYHASYTISVNMPVYTNVERWDELEAENEQVREEEIEDELEEEMQQESEGGFQPSQDNQDNEDVFEDDSEQEIQEGVDNDDLDNFDDDQEGMDPFDNDVEEEQEDMFEDDEIEEEES